MLKILQTRLQQYVNQEIPDVQTWTYKIQRHQRSNCQNTLDNRRSKEISGEEKKKLLLLPYDKAFDCGQFSSVIQSCPTLWNPTDCSKPGLPVHQQLPEFTQTHVLWVGDAISPSHPLSSPSPALNLPQHQGLFKWVSSSHQLTKVLESQFQHQSFQWIFRTDFL